MHNQDECEVIVEWSGAKRSRVDWSLVGRSEVEWVGVEWVGVKWGWVGVE